MYICSVVNADILCTFAVAPHTGAWIEIRDVDDLNLEAIVAPHTGAWIEICIGKETAGNRMSLPIRERGLKFK